MSAWQKKDSRRNDMSGSLFLKHFRQKIKNKSYLTPGGQALNWEMTENRDSSSCELR
jgi:hypothetical protein